MVKAKQELLHKKHFSLTGIKSLRLEYHYILSGQNSTINLSVVDWRGQCVAMTVLRGNDAAFYFIQQSKDYVQWFSLHDLNVCCKLQCQMFTMKHKMSIFTFQQWINQINVPWLEKEKRFAFIFSSYAGSWIFTKNLVTVGSSGVCVLV